MSGIQVHTEDPINTRTDPPPTSTGQATSTAATATASTASSTYPAAQPGARPPAPTGVASSAYTPNPTATSIYASPTSTIASSGQPPAPQPGTVPVPPSQEKGSKSTIPPPPKAGERLQSPSHYAPNPPAAVSTGQAGGGAGAGAETGYAFPSATTQGTLEQPLRGVPPAGQTSVAHPGSNQRYGAQIPSQSLEHPPGYKQDPYAGDRGPSAYNAGHGGGSGGIGGGSNNSQGEGIFTGLGDTISNLTSGAGGGSNASGGSLFAGGGGADNEEGIMSTMGTWAKGVGKKAAELESEVWKRVNGEK